jgi:hypothetical protein
MIFENLGDVRGLERVLIKLNRLTMELLDCALYLILILKPK